MLKEVERPNHKQDHERINIKFDDGTTNHGTRDFQTDSLDMDYEEVIRKHFSMGVRNTTYFDQIQQLTG
jgi:hypothetical protein